MNTQHTPAPWHVGTGNGIGSIFPEFGRTRLENGGTTLYPIAQVNQGWSVAEDEANARLIAAAPDLLAALRNVIASYRANDPDSMANAVNDAEAAIAKATGVQS